MHKFYYNYYFFIIKKIGVTPWRIFQEIKKIELLFFVISFLILVWLILAVGVSKAGLNLEHSSTGIGIHAFCSTIVMMPDLI